MSLEIKQIDSPTRSSRMYRIGDRFVTITDMEKAAPKSLLERHPELHGTFDVFEVDEAGTWVEPIGSGRYNSIDDAMTAIEQYFNQ